MKLKLGIFLITAMLTLSACGGSTSTEKTEGAAANTNTANATNQVKEEQPAHESSNTQPAPSTSNGDTAENTIDWKSSLAEIVKEDSSTTEKADSVAILAKDYKPDEEELKEFEKYIVDEFTQGKYLQKPKDAEYMLSNLFKSIVVEKSYEDSENAPIDKFAYDFYQNTKYVYRGADTPDSESVKENESQMKKALSSIK